MVSWTTGSVQVVDALAADFGARVTVIGPDGVGHRRFREGSGNDGEPCDPSRGGRCLGHWPWYGPPAEAKPPGPTISMWRSRLNRPLARWLGWRCRSTPCSRQSASSGSGRRSRQRSRSLLPSAPPGSSPEGSWARSKDLRVQRTDGGGRRPLHPDRAVNRAGIRRSWVSPSTGWRPNSRSRTACLDRQRNRLEAILRELADGIVITDHEGYVVRMNAAAERLLDANADAAIGRPFVQASRDHELQQVLQSALDDGQSDRSDRRAWAQPAHPPLHRPGVSDGESPTWTGGGARHLGAAAAGTAFAGSSWPTSPTSCAPRSHRSGRWSKPWSPGRWRTSISRSISLAGS